MTQFKRYTFVRSMYRPYEDIVIIESYQDLQDIQRPYGYELFSITKLY